MAGFVLVCLGFSSSLVCKNFIKIVCKAAAKPGVFNGRSDGSNKGDNDDGIRSKQQQQQQQLHVVEK